MGFFTHSIFGSGVCPKEVQTPVVSEFRERRKRQLVCPACGFGDIVRTRSANPIVRFLGELRGKKRFSCRSCGGVFYAFARRSSDKAIPVLEAPRRMGATLSGTDQRFLPSPSRH
jgi:ribosomal protein L37E